MFCSIHTNVSLFSSVPGRTFPTHPYFQAQLGAGQLSLYNLLKAYSLLDPEVSFNSSFSILSPPFTVFLGVSLPLCWQSKWNCLLGLSFFSPILVCVDVKLVFVVIVGGLLPGPVLYCRSAAVAHGGGGCLQHAQISNVWRGAPQTVQAWHDYPAGKARTHTYTHTHIHTHTHRVSLFHIYNTHLQNLSHTLVILKLHQREDCRSLSFYISNQSIHLTLYSIYGYTWLLMPGLSRNLAGFILDARG